MISNSLQMFRCDYTMFRDYPRIIPYIPTLSARLSLVCSISRKNFLFNYDYTNIGGSWCTRYHQCIRNWIIKLNYVTPIIKTSRGIGVYKTVSLEIPYVTNYSTLLILNDDVLTNQRQLKIK